MNQSNLRVVTLLGRQIFTKILKCGGSVDDIKVLVYSGSNGYNSFLEEFALDLMEYARYQRRMECPAAQEFKAKLGEYRRNPVENCLNANDEIETIDLSLRLWKALKCLNIRTVGELKHVHDHIQNSTKRDNTIPWLGKHLRAELRVIAQKYF